MRIVLFASGSAGNCTLVSDGDTHLLIDAGISARRIREGLHAQGLSEDDISAVLVTHEHADHIRGLQVLLRRMPAPVLALPPAAAVLQDRMPEHARRLGCLAPQKPLRIGGMTVTPFCTMHDAAASCGFRIDGCGSFGFCTDLGTVTDAVRSALCGVECAVIEANHDTDMLAHGPYPRFLKQRITSGRGHLSNADAGALAVWLAAHGTQALVLAHLSRENNTPETALAAVGHALQTAGLPDVALCAAPEAETLSVRCGAERPPAAVLCAAAQNG